MLLAVAMDSYIFFAIQRLTTRRFWAEIQLWSAVACFVAMIALFVAPKKSISEEGFRVLMWVIFALCSIYIPKLIFTLFDLAGSIPRIWGRGRLPWLDYTGIFISLAAFLMMWWGALINRYRIQIKEVDVAVQSLPQNFEGLRIAQISDLHVGSFASDTMFVSKLVDSINAAKPDLIVFTGDIVNRSSSELKPFVNTLSRLNAPYGVYSVLGNHDYGDYTSWPSTSAKKENLQSLLDMQRQMGWHLLNNSTHWLKAGGDSLAIIGV